MNTRNYFKKIAIAAISMFAINTQANNLQITGTSVDTAAGEITFNIKWDNSWKTNIAPANYDAVWVYVKYQDCADKLWRHANLSPTSANHVAGGTILKIDGVSDGKGAFIYRKINGGGNIPSTSIKLKMNIAAGNYDNYNFKVMGIEMVNIPQETSYWIGDGVSTGAFTKYEITSNSSISSGSIGTGNSAPSTFPKGWQSFYTMKYEISQQQYVEFLNTLTYDQQVRRSVASPDSPAATFAFYNAVRNGLKIQVPGSNAAVPAVYACDLTPGDFGDLNDGQNIAMDYLSYNDTTAYLDWAALRPMSEIEFEKICRGPIAPVANEYAWGTIALTNIAASNVTNPGLANEGSNIVSNGLANWGYKTGNSYLSYGGPLKVGFSATNSSGRASAAASYYGVMEMSGNIGEFAVSAKTTGGSTYTGVLGDGELSTIAATNGDSNQTLWPDETGVFVKGGHFYAPAFSENNSVRLRVSDRNEAAVVGRQPQYGGRGVR
jgi:formylglycine-generating enzyme required for sulfatase activity